MYTQKKHKMTRLYHRFLAQEQYTQGINEGNKNLCGMFLECNIYILISTSFFFTFKFPSLIKKNVYN